MKLFFTHSGPFLQTEKKGFLLKDYQWDELLNQPNLHAYLESLIPVSVPWEGPSVESIGLLPPIGEQEIWASGVTYFRSREARMEESEQGADFYDLVYEAERPELFFKSTAARAIGPGGLVRIRPDSDWDVPEPELTLFVNTAGEIAAYTIGNDMSSRSIEGENPLYLPQAKVYEGSAALGPCLWIPPNPIDPATEISLLIRREGKALFEDRITLNQMKRSHTDLVEYLYRELTFPHGCFLMTGTGIVPPTSFTLQSKDEITITIPPIGTLTNVVA